MKHGRSRLSLAWLPLLFGGCFFLTYNVTVTQAQLEQAASEIEARVNEGPAR